MKEWRPEQLIKDCEERADLKKACDLFRQFRPDEGVDYAWIVKNVKERYTFADTAFKNLDDKATTLIGTLGSGAGLLTLGSVVALSANQVSPWVVLFALPSLWYAARSLRTAAKVRMPQDYGLPPTADSLIKLTEDYKNGDAEALSIGAWEISTEQIYLANERKSALLIESQNYFSRSISFLCLPVIAGILVKFFCH